MFVQENFKMMTFRYKRDAMHKWPVEKYSEDMPNYVKAIFNYKYRVSQQVLDRPKAVLMTS